MEAFVTPIILSYVQKYVNLRRQDAQLSLWEGDAVFQNLDMRLDVLQAEFELPFEFLSGHIHELIIHIPWTKITSEPISITINTIEFVLKLRDLRSTGFPSTERVKSSLSQDDSAKGYITTLVDKIVKNISITCNNIILKYVEEDIVVSMNIQLLTFCSANNQWEPCFVDVNPTNVVLRRLVQISDLTICLDKRNSAGQIDVCLEPILYKCSLEVRVILSYFPNRYVSSGMVIEMFTKSLELNISSQQFPMVMRLLMLALSLKNGELHGQTEDSQIESAETSKFLDPNSMLSWAWSKVPSIFPEESTDNGLENTKGSFMNFGTYIGHLSLTIKSLETIADAIVHSSRKVRYIPIVKLNLNGNYFETCIRGYKWFNGRGGISQICVEPLGSFTKMNVDSIIFTKEEVSNAYLQGSLFDLESDHTVEEVDFPLKFDFDTHLKEVDENYLSFRSPAASFDMLHVIDIADRYAFNTELGRNLEYSNLPEKTIIRAYLAGLTLKHNSEMRGIVSALSEMISSYDYPPYIEKKSGEEPEKLPPPLMDDYDALMYNIPRKTMFLKLKDLRLELHSLYWAEENPASKTFPNKKMFIGKLIPFMVLNIRTLSLNNVAPIYEDRLVHTTCQLPIKPKELLEASYSTIGVEVSEMSLDLVNRAKERTIVKIEKIRLDCGNILKKSCWDDDVEQIYVSGDIDGLQVLLSQPQQMVFAKLIRTSMMYNQRVVLEVMKSGANKQLCSDSLDIFDMSIPKIHIHFTRFRHTIGIAGFIQSLHLCLVKPKHISEEKIGENFVIFDAPKDKSAESFVKWKLQLPKKVETQTHARVAYLAIQESVFVCHPCLETMFYYAETIEMDVLNVDLKRKDVDHKVSHVSAIPERNTKKTNQPDETIHLSSDKGEKCDVTPTSSDAVHNSDEYRSYVTWEDMGDCLLFLEIDQCEIIFPEQEDYNYGKMSSLEYYIAKQARCITIKLPDIKFKSSSNLFPTFETGFPIKIEEFKAIGTNFSWMVELSELAVSMIEDRKSIYILYPMKTNVTLAVDRRDIKEISRLRFNLHLDTAPVNCHIHENQIKLLKKSIFRLTSLKNILGWSTTSSNIPKLSTSTTFEEDLDIKEFLGINSNSDFSADVVSSHSKIEMQDLNDHSTVSIWLQWTFTKVMFNFYIERLSCKSKLVLDLEDFITSIDKQSFYFKLKSKIGALSVEYYEMGDVHDWTLSDDLKMVAQPQSSENERLNAFLDLTITTAEVKNVFKKWGTHTKSEVLNTLTEIVLNLKAIQFQLSLKGIASILPLMQLLAFENDPPVNDLQSSEISTKSVADLPLVHFNCKGIVIYIPENYTTENCDVIIFKVDSINIGPNAENPLTRIPLRPDVYTKAEQLRILNTPGSRVEDRQYELVLNNISAVTSSWLEVLSVIKQNNMEYSSNPAVIWNNLEKEPTIKIENIFNNFKISVIYAPCILYKSTLICGQSLEINCVTDLIVDITVDQMLLISNLLKNLPSSFWVSSLQTVSNSEVSLNTENKFSVTSSSTRSHVEDLHSNPSNKKPKNQITGHTDLENMTRTKRIQMEEKATLKQQHNSEHIYTDSGFASVEKTSFSKSISECRTIPYDLSLVAGDFLVRLHRKKQSTAHVTLTDNESAVLMNLKITQPSMLVTKKMYDYTIKYSLFDLSIRLGKSECDTSNGVDTLFETEKGNVNSRGIPLPLLSVTYNISLRSKVHISCYVSRPIRIHVCDNSLKSFFSIQTMVNQLFKTVDEHHNTNQLKPILRGTPIQMLRNSLFDADTLVVSLDQFQFDCINQSKVGFKININKSNLSIENNAYPESLSISYCTESIFVQSSTRTLIHPMTIKCDLLLKQEQWHKFPVINIKLDTNLLHVDINPRQILNLVEIQRNLMDVWSEHGSKQDNCSKDDLKLFVETDSKALIKIALPKAKRTRGSQSQDEFFQDDLRAGAFQIKEEDDSSSDASLPLPYQMKICSNNKTICWRYPQPRFITNLMVLPMLLENEILTSINCGLEYYNDILDAFMPYVEFSLSERETRSPKLPEIKNPAFIWRIIIQNVSNNSCDPYEVATPNETSRNIEQENGEFINIKDFLNVDVTKGACVVNPKELISCLRIDSLFQPMKTPIIQAVLRIPHLHINLQNEFQRERFKLPHPIENFSIATDFCRGQTFASIYLSKINVLTTKTKQNQHCTYFDFSLASKVLDASNFNMIDFLEPTNIKGCVSIEKKTDCDIIIDEMRFNFGPDLMQTMLSSKHLWLQVLNDNCTNMPIMTRLVICNMTNVPFDFGQSNSNEQIILKPNECTFYAFRSDYLKRHLTFMFANDSCVLNTYQEGTQYLQMEHCIIVAKFLKLSSTQMCIFIKGQVEILSMSKERFEVQYVNSGVKKHLYLGAYGHGSFVSENEKEQQCCIRLKFAEAKVWSGEIPLTSKSIPWLVKVPSLAPQQYTSFWVRIIEEDISNSTVKRLLILIWPMFVVRSLLPLETCITDLKSGHSYLLAGKGAVEELSISGDNFSEHEFRLEGVSLPTLQDNIIVLTYRGIRWSSFFEMENKKIKIDNYVEALKKSAETKWNFSNYEMSKKSETISKANNLCCVHRTVPSHKYSSCVMLEVVPCCIFLNSTGRNVKVVNSLTDESIEVESNYVAPLFTIESAFKLEIDYGTHCSDSCLIYVKEDQFKSSLSKDKLLLPERGSLVFYVYHSSTASRFILISSDENNVRILKLSSPFAVLNYSGTIFDVVPFASLENEKISEKDIIEVANILRLKIRSTKEPVGAEGMPIDNFFNFSERACQKQAQVLLKHYICIIGHQDDKLSLPLLICKPFNKKCLNVFSYNASVPLSACVVESQGQFLISVFKDKCPKFQIHNHTDLTFFVAGTKTSEGEKTSKVMQELDEKSLEWFQKVHSKSDVFYTPYESYRNFPESENISCNLSLALCLKSNVYEPNVKRIIRWSKPLKVESSRETLLNIPFHGDVKILVCNNHRTAKISIFYISQGMEFSVEELRTRLSHSGKKMSLKHESSEHMQGKTTDSIDQCSVETFCATCLKKNQNHEMPNLNILFNELNINMIFDSKRKICAKDCILSIYLDHLVIAFSNEKRMLSVVVTNLQLDNQLYVSGKYDFPVMVCAEKEYFKRACLPSILVLNEYIESLKHDALIELQICFYKEGMHPKTVNCKIKPIRAYIEDTYVNDLLEYLIDCDPSNAVYIYEDISTCHFVSPGYVSIPDSAIDEAFYLSGALHLRSIRIEPISLMLSVHTCVRFYIALDHSRLYFSTFEKADILTLPLKLGNTIGMHYLSGAIFGAGWVVGSLEILGSPGGLARSVSTGLKDFVSLPVRGLLRGPWGFLTGVTQGSASLLKNITAGTVNSVTKLASSVARNLDRLTLDEEHFKRTEALRRLRPQGLTEGFAQGLTGLGISLLGALGGLARHPLEARSSVQVVTGVAKGIVGAFTKPLSGAAELLALTGQGMLHTVGFNTMPVQRNENVCRNLAMSPGDCKLAWELLPNYCTLSIDQLLFFHDATLVSEDQLNRVVIAVTPMAFMILECKKGWQTEILPIESIDVSIDPFDKTLFEVKMLPTDEYVQEADTEFFKSRMMSFLRDSSENLPRVAINSVGEIRMNQSVSERRYQFKRKFYVDEYLASHLVNYVNILKNTGFFKVVVHT